jgi:hypothetical protein
VMATGGSTNAVRTMPVSFELFCVCTRMCVCVCVEG